MSAPTTYWWMFDNHTFRDLGADLDAAIAKARDCWELDPCGTLLIHCMKPHAAGQGRDKKPEFIAALAAFREDVMAMQDPGI